MLIPMCPITFEGLGTQTAWQEKPQSYSATNPTVLGMNSTGFGACVFDSIWAGMMLCAGKMVRGGLLQMRPSIDSATAWGGGSQGGREGGRDTWV